MQLTVKLHPDLPLIEVSPREIEQVLVNLMLNALDAMPPGGELTIETELSGPNAVTGHEGERPEGFIAISVADNGVGIPESLQAKIFEPFFTPSHPAKEPAWDSRPPMASSTSTTAASSYEASPVPERDSPSTFL